MEFLADYDIDIAYYPNKVNVVVDALSRRQVACIPKLAAMGIEYENQREDVADRHLVAVLVRLTISLTIANHVVHAQAIDQLH